MSRWVLLFFFLSRLAFAEVSAFVNSRHPLFSRSVRPALIQTKALYDRSTELMLRQRNNPKGQAVPALREDVGKLALELVTVLEDTEKAKDETQKALGQLLDQFNTDSGKRLGDLAETFQKTLGELRGDSEVRQTLESEADPVLSRLGPWIAPVVRAYTLEGGNSIEPVVQLFELSAASSLLIHAWMQLSQVYAVTEYLDERLKDVAPSDRQRPIARMALSAYLETRDQFQNDLGRLRALFPGFPVFNPSDFGSPDAQSSLRKEIHRFMASFARPDGQIGKAYLERIEATTQSLIDRYLDMESFGAQAYPYLEKEDESYRLTVELLSRPEFQECAALAHGLVRSDFLEGPGCDVKAFRNALAGYRSHHEKQAGYGLLPALVELFGAYESDLKLKKITWKALEAKADEEVQVLGNLNAQVLAAWPKAKDTIFSQPEELEKRLGQGLALHDYLASRLLQSGVNPLLGLDARFEPTLFASKDLMEGLDQAIPAGVQRIERLSSLSDCRAFDKNDVKASPYVAWTQTLLPMDGEGAQWTDASPSTHGFQRLLWLHKIKVANAVNLPRTEHPEAFLAGSLRWTAMSRYLPNLVLLKLFNGEKIPSDSLAALGVQEAKGDFDALFARRKGGPPYAQILSDARGAFGKMLAGFAENNPKLVGANADNPAALQKLFRQRYRQELALAAKQMQSWGDEYERLNSGSTTEERYQAIQGAPRGELCKLFGLPPEHCPASLERGTAMSLMRDLFPQIKHNYCQRHGLKGDVTLTPEMFLEELVMHKGVLGGSVPVLDLTSEEINRYRMYTREWITPEIYRIWAGRISALQKIHEHTQNIYVRRKDTFAQMRQLMFQLFPPLKVEVAEPGTRAVVPAWKWFEDREDHFNAVMGAYTQQAVALINEVQALDSDSAALNFLLPVLPLVDQTLRYFPENKKEVCSQQASRKFWEGVQTGALATGEFAGAAAMGLGPVGVAVGGGVFAVALTVDYSRLQREGAELARSKAHELSSWSQVSAETSANGMRVVDVMARTYGADQTLFFIQAGLTAATAGYFGVKNIAAIGRIPGALHRGSEAYIAGFRVAKGLRPLRATNQWRYWTRLPGRMTRSAMGNRQSWELLLKPFERRGFVTAWAHPTLMKLWSTPIIKGPGLWKMPINKAAALTRWSWSMLAEFPACLVGKSLMPGLVNTTWQAPLVAGGISLVYAMVREGLVDGVNEKFWDRLQMEPEIYEPLLLRVLNGELSPEGMRAVVEADLRYREIWDNALGELKQEAMAENVSIEGAKDTLAQWRDQIQGTLDQGPKTDVHAFPRRQQVREIDRLLQRL